MKPTIAVGVSGGVDSSVAAYLLVKEWENVIGVSHYICHDSHTCNEETLSRAAAVCAQLGVPYKRYDLVKDFERCVINDFVETYLKGETPNPCVRCNERVRFGTFYSLVERDTMGANERLYFATGHYVRTVEKNGTWFLRKGVDEDKDQSYMLYKIDPMLLPYLRFPLGEYTKPEAVSIAEKAGLPTVSIKESQDICFITGDYTDFISSRIDGPGEPGLITDTLGNKLGPHRGYIHYTIGQRKGLGLSDGPWYVVKIDAPSNTVVVGRREELSKKTFTAGELNWFISPPAAEMECEVKIRYNSPPIKCVVHPAADGPLETGMVKVELETPGAVTPGQSAVFYEGELVLGGGIIKDATR